jgi:hypothetical protein
MAQVRAERGEFKMAPKTKKTVPAKKVTKPVYPTPEDYPTQHEGDYELEMGLPENHRYEMAKTNQATHYFNATGWVIKVVPAGSMVALAVYVHGVLVEEGTMDLEEGRGYAAALLGRGYKKVPKLF